MNPHPTIRTLYGARARRLAARSLAGTLPGRVAGLVASLVLGFAAGRSTADSAIADGSVNACIARAFGNMAFPEPEGGIVTVVYPLVFSKE